jgi:hypothetical protein
MPCKGLQENRSALPRHLGLATHYGMSHAGSAVPEMSAFLVGKVHEEAEDGEATHDSSGSEATVEVSDDETTGEFQPSSINMPLLSLLQMTGIIIRSFALTLCRRCEVDSRWMRIPQDLLHNTKIGSIGIRRRPDRLSLCAWCRYRLRKLYLAWQ